MNLCVAISGSLIPFLMELPASVVNKCLGNIEIDYVKGPQVFSLFQATIMHLSQCDLCCGFHVKNSFIKRYLGTYYLCKGGGFLANSLYAFTEKNKPLSLGVLQDRGFPCSPPYPFTQI